MEPEYIRMWVNYHIGQPCKRGFWQRLRRFFL